VELRHGQGEHTCQQPTRMARLWQLLCLIKSQLCLSGANAPPTYTTTAAAGLQKTEKGSKHIGYQDIRRLFGRATQV
jgi:hypothetical protein